MSQAREREREYDWLGTIDSYMKALDFVSEQDFSKMAEAYERLGYAFHRLAMQGESTDEFRERTHQAIANYEKAKKFYGKLAEAEKSPRTLRCDAMIAYLGYWLAPEVLEKKKLLDNCWRLTQEALNGFRQCRESWEHGKTYNQLLISAILKCTLESDYSTREKTIREAMEHGEQALKFLPTYTDNTESTKAYVRTTSVLEWFGYYFLNLEDRERYYQKALGYWLKANELSEEVAMVELLNSAMVDHDSLGWGLGTNETLANFKKALEYAKKTKDKFTIGCALDWLAYHSFWKAETTEDPDEVVKALKTALQYAEEAHNQYSPINIISPRWGVLWVEAPHAEYYFELADRETNLRKKANLLKKALEAAPEALERAENSGYPEAVFGAHHNFGKILAELATMEMNFEEKRRLLERALGHRKETIRFTEQLTPFDYYNQGVMLNRLAQIKSELASLAEDSENKINMLQEAILDRENSLKLCMKHTAFYQKKGSVSQFAPMGIMQYYRGDLIYRLYELTKNKEHLSKAAEAFEEAIESFQKVAMTSRIAECHWKIAQIYDVLCENLKAAENFDLASNNYKEAAEKIPELKDFYQDHALYMKAWSEIEQARHLHREQQYGVAEEHFEKAANIHKFLKQWSYLAPNYAAWVKVEHAEELSRREQSEEAIEAFEQAVALFNDAKKSIKMHLGKIEDLDERQMATSMVKATDFRYEYCVARKALEEAKILDKKGDHYSSSEKYASATHILEKIAQELESEQDQKEIRYIISLSRAWEKMTRAEAEAAPTMYIEASRLFEEAKELSSSEKTKMLALGHSRFCRALEAGTKLIDTRDATWHAAATQHLESAATYYMRAGLQSVSEYAKATGLLFDACVYLDKAKEETDPEKRAKLYLMAEKVLQTSAGSYMKAKHPEKREQALRLLKRVKEERELALSLTEVLHAPLLHSTTAFTTPTPTYEKAVGLEKFEHADVRANLITSEKELKIGENLHLEIEIVNAGKASALLTKIAELIPEGFEVIGKPETYRVEDSNINMKGKRLEPLKTEEVRLVLKPKVQGVFFLRPKILYLDENGQYKANEPESVAVTVKELGISGWLKGPKKEGK